MPFQVNRRARRRSAGVLLAGVLAGMGSHALAAPAAQTTAPQPQPIAPPPQLILVSRTAG